MDESASQIMVNRANPDQLKELVLSLVKGINKSNDASSAEPSPAKVDGSGPSGLASTSLKRRGTAEPAPEVTKPLPRHPRPGQKPEDSEIDDLKKELQAQMEDEEALDGEPVEEGDGEDWEEDEWADDGDLHKDDSEKKENPSRNPYARANATSHRKEWMTMSRRMEAPDARARWPEVAKLWETGRDASQSLCLSFFCICS